MNNFRPPFFYPPHYPHYFNNYQPYRSILKNNKPQELLPTTSNSDNVKSNLEDEKKCDEHTKKRHFNSSDKKNPPLLEFAGIKLYSDDVLILALIYFLYKENIDDKLLLIALFSLLF